MLDILKERCHALFSNVLYFVKILLNLIKQLKLKINSLYMLEV